MTAAKDEAEMVTALTRSAIMIESAWAITKLKPLLHGIMLQLASLV
jgi:hypothetical protein